MLQLNYSLILSTIKRIIAMPKEIPAVIRTYFMYGQPTKSPIEAIIANCNPIANAIFTFLLITFFYSKKLIKRILKITKVLIN